LRIESKANISNNNGNFTDKTFVLTGETIKFKNRSELTAFIEQNGGKVVGSVSKNTDYLVNNDILSTSGKNKKANELGVEIVSEEALVAMAD